jgi:cytochrome c nitrite reductase small subunit
MNRPTRYLMGMTASGLALSVALGIALGTGTYTGYYAEGFSYLSSDPRACVNCHMMRDHYDGWSKASHHAVATCNDCHSPHDFLRKYWTKAENGFWHSKAFTLQDFHDPLVIRPKNARILQNSCIRCHTEMVAHIIEDEALEDGGAAYCVRCHASVGHGPAR